MNNTKSLLIVSVVLALAVTTFSFAKAEDKKELKLIVLAADFPDAPHKNEFGKIYDDIFSPEKESLTAFFEQASSDTVTVSGGSFKTKDWERMPEPITFYAQDSKDGFDINCQTMIAAVIKKALDDGLEIDEYRKNWGKMPCLCVVVSGDAEGYTNFPKNDGFWPHASAIEIVWQKQVIILRYILIVEGKNEYANPASVVVHEFGHLMGLADLYDYECGGPFKGECSYPFTYFDIMVARHGGRGFSGLHRERLGFVKPIEVKTSGEYTLPPITTNALGSYLKVHIPGTEEYLGVEYRKRVGIDAFWGGIPCEGILIYKVDPTIEYSYRFNDGKNGRFAVQILNPSKTFWHNKACYSLESGHNIASAKTDPSTLPYNNGFTKTVKIEVISQMSDTVTIRITYTPRESIKISIMRNFLTAGTYHWTKLDIMLINKGEDVAKISSSGEGYIEPDTVELAPEELFDVTLLLTYPEENMKDAFIEKVFYLETENQRFPIKLTLRNIFVILDANKNGEIELEDLYTLAYNFDKGSKADTKYDVNGDERVDFEDLMICSKYVGLKYR